MSEENEIDPNFPYLIKAASEKAGSQNKLAAVLGWNPGALRRVQNGGEKISAYRAAKLYEYLSMDPEEGIAGALYLQSKSEPERAYWAAMFGKYYSKKAEGVISELEKLSKSMKVKPASRFIDERLGGGMAVGEGLEVLMGGRTGQKK